MGKKMGVVNKYTQTTMSIISKHLKYMNTLNFQIFSHYWTYMTFAQV
jgi:hypothetical protein